ncbi:tripartite tricarboxylate transporter substrate binding protein [Hoeflea sp. CAU 1731]
MTFKTFLKTASIAALIATGSEAIAQDYPSEPIRMVVPWKAGGGTDSIARALAKAIEAESDGTVIIENISGGGRVPGHLAVVNASPDGYTLLLNGSSDISSSQVFREMPFTLDDFTCVGGVYSAPLWIVVNSESGYETLEDYTAAAAAKPGELTLGVTTLNSPDEVLGKAVAEKFGIDVRIIPFNGGANMKKALLAGQVDAGIFYVPVMLPEVEAGLAGVIMGGGSLENVRYEEVRDAPTPADLGLEFEIGSYRGVLMPAGVSNEVLAEVSALVEAAAKSEIFAAFGETFGSAPKWVSGPEYCDVIRSEMDTFEASAE